jgi:hypothetical protein
VRGSRTGTNPADKHKAASGLDAWNEEIAEGVVADAAFEIHHFGCVRRAARLRQKWRTQALQHDANTPRWDKIPGFVYDMMPHKWDDKDFLNDLAVYYGPSIEAVRNDEDEFIRDDMWLYDYLIQKNHAQTRAEASADCS